MKTNVYYNLGGINYIFRGTRKLYPLLLSLIIIINLIILLLAVLTPTEKSPDYRKMIFSTKIILSLVWYVAPWMCFLVVCLGFDPLSLITGLFPSNTLLNWALFLVRVVLIFNFGNELLMSAILYFIYGIMVVCHIIDFTAWIESQIRINCLDAGIMRFYRELQVWNGYLNRNFCYFVVPPLIFFGELSISLCTYGAIRMTDKIPWILYPVIVGADAIGILFAVTLIPYAAKAFENSDQYLQRQSRGLSGKYDRRLVKSLRPLAIAIGPFGRVDKGLCTEFF